MGNRPNGGAAFPRPLAVNPNNSEVSWDQDGMTLRDYFAAKAMQAHLQVSGDYGWARIALDAYRVADAMIAERDK